MADDKDGLFGATRLLLSIVAVGLLTPALAAQGPAPVDGQQRLAMHAKPAVVKVVDGFRANFRLRSDAPEGKELAQRPIRNPVEAASTGSGFFLNPDGYVATNAHVTEATRTFGERGSPYAAEVLVSKLCTDLLRNVDCRPGGASGRPGAGFLYVQRNFEIDPSSFFHYHHVVIPDGSNYPFEIKSYGRPVGEGKDVAILKIEVRNAPTLRIAQSGAAELQDHVTVLGYPGASESQVLDERSSLEVSITDGRISARKAMADAAPVLQISAPASNGNSGGPVMNDAGEVIGLLTFGGDRPEPGFTFAIPATTVMEFVRTAGAEPRSGDVDARYQEGLKHFWAGENQQAIQKFEEVRRLFPEHSEVTELIQTATGRSGPGSGPGPAPTPLPLPDPWYKNPVYVALVLGGLGLLGLVGWIATRQKGTSLPPATPAAGTPPAAGPRSHGVPPAGDRTGRGNSPPPFVDDGEDRTVRVGAKAPANLGSLACVDGPLSGQRFNITAEGLYIGRDAALSQIVIDDHRVSKRHVWIGPRSGRVIAIDQASTNGSFINRVGETFSEVTLNSGDTIIVAEPEVGQFVYKR